MASFAEGIAQGLIQGNQMAQAESDNRRKDAMNLLALNAQADDIEFKREERNRLKKFRTELVDINNRYYGPKEVEEKVQLPAAVDNPNAEPQFEIRKKTIQLLPGQDPANDMAFLGDMFKARVAHGDVTTEDFGKMVELRDKMDKNGITKALGNYMLSKDPKALEPITGKIGADAGSLKIITQEDKKNPGLPQTYLTYTKDGSPVQVDIEVYAAAMGIENPFGKALDKNLGRKHIVAQTNASNASAIASKADANYKNLVGPALANKYNADANKSNYLADNDGSSGKKPLEVPAPKSNPIEPDKALKLPRANVARSTMLATIQAETGSTNKTVSNYVTQQFNQIYNDAVSTTERYYAEQKAQGKLKGDPMFNEFNENVDKLIDAKVQQWLRLDRSQDIDALKKNIQTRKSAIVTSNATSTD